jgi:hypothetical protein
VRHELAPAAARSDDGSGRAMHDGAPPEARSNARSSGPEQLPGREQPGRGGGGGAEKSGSRNGLASCGRSPTGHDLLLVLRRRGRPQRRRARPRRGSSTPPATRISRIRRRVSGSTCASSVSSVSSVPSRAAVRASAVAIPSRRLSCSLRRPSGTSWPCRRVRSSRTSSATAWNVLRVDARGRPRSTASSTSRTALASTGTMPCSARLCERAGRPAAASLRGRRRSRVATQLPSS